MKINKFKLISFYYSFNLLILILGVTSVIRQLGVFDTTKILLLLSWFSDLGLIILYIFISRNLNFPKWLIPYIVILYSGIGLGLVNHQFNHTFLTDTAIYFSFFIKIAIFSNLFRDEVYRIQFERFIVRYCKIAIYVAVATIAALSYLKSIGLSFYFSSSPDLTFSYALSLVQGKMLESYFILMLALLSGKKMLFIGLVIILLLAFRSRFNRVKNYFIVAAFIIPFILLTDFSSISELPGPSKFLRLLKIDENDLYNMLMVLDRPRFSEILGIVNSMNWYDYIVGKGFGFRFFWFDYPELKEANITHSNAHFSPLGIVSKFGFIGFLIFSYIFFFAVFNAYKKRMRSKYLYASYLFLCSMLIQSLFAYILFNNVLIPLIIAYVMVDPKDYESIRRI